MIEVENLSLVIRKKTILSKIDLKLEPGTVYGLVGNNGSGKTMLMKCICGFVKPTEGVVRVDGKVIGKDMDYLKNAGIIIETPGFLPYYSGFRNLKLLADINGRAKADDIRDAMKRCGLDPALRLPVRKYSLGMRQRLGIAQAIMERQEILILDEPMNGLDRHGTADIRELILQMKQQGKLILLASHNKPDIDILCDAVFEMDGGCLTAQA